MFLQIALKEEQPLGTDTVHHQAYEPENQKKSISF